VAIRLSTGDPRPIYQQIVDEVRRGIAVGSLPEHTPLPSIRDMARELRVNPNTVQLAYRELERIGVVYVRRGQGTYVANSGASEHDRHELARSVASRALHDALRHGLTPAELIDSIRSEAMRSAHTAERDSIKTLADREPE
jgi:GntR family transcriptional regulator